MYTTDIYFVFQLVKPTKDGYCQSRTGVTQFAAPDSDKSRTFFGTGYVKSGEYDSDPMGEMDFTFTTSSSNGILVIGIDDDNPSLFQAVELSDGHIKFTYNMGYGYREVRSTKVYDTGKPVTVNKASNPRGSKYTFKITSSGSTEELARDTWYYTRINRLKFVNADYVYWGGIENRTMIPANV